MKGMVTVAVKFLTWSQWRILASIQVGLHGLRVSILNSGSVIVCLLVAFDGSFSFSLKFNRLADYNPLWE